MDPRTAPKASATRASSLSTTSRAASACCEPCFVSFHHGHAYQITTAESATDAFSLLRQEQFNLILLDIVMPATRGHWIKEKNLCLGLLARFRDLGVTAPVLMMTGIAKDVAKEVEARERGSGGRPLQAD